MNEFFYESRGKEKIKELMEEGMRGAGTPKSRRVKAVRVQFVKTRPDAPGGPGNS